MSQKNQNQKQEAEAKNELVAKQSNQLVDSSSLEFKGNEEASASDIIVPRMLLMQGMSKWVPDHFSQGDIINSVEETLLAKRGETVSIIPFILKKTWQIFTQESPPQWVREEPWNEANDALEWEFEEEDADRGVVQLKRQRQYGFYAFVVKDEVDPFPIPVLVNFRSSAGFKEGKKIASHFSMMKGMNQPGFNVVWNISSESVKDGDKSYQKFVVKKGRMTTKEEAQPILQWLKLMQTAADKIKDHDVDDTADIAGPSAPGVQKGEVSQQAQF